MQNKNFTPPKVRKAIVVVFLSTTMVFLIISVYTMYIYSQMFIAVRAFYVEIDEFSFNASSAILKTVISIHNPSEGSFDVLYITEYVTVRGIFIRNAGVYMQARPLKLRPYQNVTIPIKADCSTKISEITASLKRKWQVQIRLKMRGVLVGEFFHKEYLTTAITES